MFKSSFIEPRQKNKVSVVKEQQAKMPMVLLAANSGRVINDSFFSHESSKFPPSLTRKGEIYHGNKSEILQCIVPPDLENHRPVTTASVLHGAWGCSSSSDTPKKCNNN